MHIHLLVLLQIYNEVVNDLLNPANANLRIREDTKKGIYVEGLKEDIAMSADQVCSRNAHLGLIIGRFIRHLTCAAKLATRCFRCFKPARHTGILAVRTTMTLAGNDIYLMPRGGSHSLINERVDGLIA